ncbi:hypothetical protein HN51_063214 [Arachis hypogaea]
MFFDESLWTNSFIPKSFNDKELLFLKRCKENQNTKSLYREGLRECLGNENAEGLRLLDMAAKKGHKEAKYVYNMILLCSSRQDKKLIELGLRHLRFLRESKCVIYEPDPTAYKVLDNEEEEHQNNAAEPAKKNSNSPSVSGEGYASLTVTYPPNYRYYNCSEDISEEEDVDYEEFDIDDYEDDEEFDDGYDCEHMVKTTDRRSCPIRPTLLRPKTGQGIRCQLMRVEETEAQTCILF